MESNIPRKFLKCWDAIKRGITPPNPQPDFVQVLEKIGSELLNQEIYEERNEGNKILITSFSIHEPCFLHDRILSYALQLRGASIIPMYCDSIQTNECNVYGGVWGGSSFKKNCKHCREQSELLWRDNPIKPLQLSKYINTEETLKIDQKIASIDIDWRDYQEGVFSFGEWAKDILVNNYVVGNYHLIPQYNELGKNYVRNLLLLKTAYSNIIDETQPDRVISNDSYYGMWAILQKICEQRSIPFYSHWIGGRPDGWCYAYNDAPMNLDFSKPWNTFVKIPLNKGQKQKIKDWIDTRSTGKGMILDTASLQVFNSDNYDFSRINLTKPTALLPSNVIWDLAALNKQIVFLDMVDWIEQTIYWFADHPEYQLVIKPHPGELHPAIPATKERVNLALSEREVTIPPNVFLLTPRVKCTVYDLLSICTVGLVHTTTVGIEMAAKGIPVITTARAPYRGFGFTLDPTTQEDYYDDLGRCLAGQELIERQRQIERAYKFILFYHFHYYTKIDIMDYSWGKSPQLKVRSISDLTPGKNVCLDYVVDSILDGAPIVSEIRWPPES